MGPNPWNDCVEASKIWKRERDTQPSENMETRKQDILPNGDWPWLYGKVLSSDSLEVSVFLFLSIQSSATFTFFPSYIILQVQNTLISLKCLLFQNACYYQTTRLNFHPPSVIGDKGFFFPRHAFFWGGEGEILILLCRFYIISDFNLHDFIMALTELLKTWTWVWGLSPESCPWRPLFSGQVQSSRASQVGQW